MLVKETSCLESIKTLSELTIAKFHLVMNVRFQWLDDVEESFFLIQDLQDNEPGLKRRVELKILKL